MRLTYGIPLVLLLAGQADATNYYVATNGSDSGAGTLASPYQTIQKAANMAQAGDNVYIHGGTYREQVTVANSGTSSAPITFQPYNGEQVTISGLDQVNTGWTLSSGSIYSQAMTGATGQVFVGGQMMAAARWPDAGYNNPLHANFATVGSASQPVSSCLDDHRHGPQWHSQRHLDRRDDRD